MLATPYSTSITSTDSTVPVFRARGLTKIYHVGEVDIFALRGIDLDLFAAAWRPCSHP